MLDFGNVSARDKALTALACLLGVALLFGGSFGPALLGVS